MELRLVNDGGIERIGFKKDMSIVELYGIEGIITELHDGEIFDYTVDDLELAYTSSSSYAMYNVCGDCYIGDDAISHIGVLNDGRMVLVARDDYANERYWLID